MTRFLRYSLVVGGLGLVLHPSGARAQAAHATVSAGYGVASLKWPSLTQFLDSYNRVNPAASAATLGSARVQSVTAAAYGIMSFGFQRLTATASSAFPTGGRRDFTAHQNLFVTAFEPSFQRAHFFAGGSIGFYAGTTRLATDFVYSDGTRSWGSDRVLNGNYAATTVGGCVGAKVGVSWKQLALTLRGDYFSKGLVKSQLTDRAGGKSTTANAFSGAASPDFLPTDYEAYLAAPFDYDTVDDVVQNDLSSLRVQLQLGIMIAPFDLD